ncbi:MAG: hypothetical protein HXS52_00960 [Theionarchaea archaeon]|nr:hypothetical protein [Theionarchaea archaeon]MBU7036473.1 hypothetical protein [Theionarchaea archaeon]
MERQKENSIELEINRIISIEQQIKRSFDEALKGAAAAALKTGDAVLFNMGAIDEKRDEMVVLTSTLVGKEKELLEIVIEMTEVLSRFLTDSYAREGWGQPDIIPTHFNLLGTHWEYLCNGYQGYTAPAERLANLSSYNPSASRPMIQNSADLVKEACGLEITAVTKNNWKAEGETHPDGIVGHVYDILLAHETKCLQEGTRDTREERSIPVEFKKQFRNRANRLRRRANRLWTEANILWKQAKDDDPTQVTLILHCFEEAVGLFSINDKIDSAPELVEDVRKFIENLSEPFPQPPSDRDDPGS